jgi:hypothetical protein
MANPIFPSLLIGSILPHVFTYQTLSTYGMYLRRPSLFTVNGQVLPQSVRLSNLFQIALSQILARLAYDPSFLLYKRCKVFVQKMSGFSPKKVTNLLNINQQYPNVSETKKIVQ